MNHLTAIVFILKVLGATGQNIGCFGDKCQYGCYCLNGKCQTNGLCEAGVPCIERHFGMQCQYINIAFGLTQQYPVLHDENFSSCMTEKKNEVTISVKLTRFTFLIIGFNDMSYVPSIDETQITLFRNSNNVSCTSWVNFQRWEKRITFMCVETTEEVDSVVITGEVVPLMCEVHVSGGRNVALLKNVTVSSALNSTYLATNAVDGKFGDSFKANDCIATAGGEKLPELAIFFPSPVSIHFIIIRNNPTTTKKLKGFTLTSNNASSMPMSTYEDLSNTTEKIYHIQHDPKHKVHNIRLMRPPDKESDVIEICELQAYGDCPPGMTTLNCQGTCAQLCNFKCTTEGVCLECPTTKYGPFCQNNCKSTCTRDSNGPDCSRVSGNCLKKCKIGMYGAFCNFTCPANCRENTECHQKSATCIEGCKPGFHGPTCAQTCPSNCKANSSCDTFTKECKEGCVAGFTGTFCNQSCPSNCISCDISTKECKEGCVAGSTGTFCNEPCPANCKGNTACHQKNTTCLAGCKPGYHGATCTQTCPSKCKTNISCDTFTGECIEGCVAGFTGTFCNKSCLLNCEGSECYSSTNFTCPSGCKKGYTKNDCTEKCPPTCKDGICSQTTAFCVSCEPGVYGKICSLNCSSHCKDTKKCKIDTGACEGGCQEGYYLENCTQNCTGHCPRCDITNGKCPGSCKRGFHGENCDKGCPKGCKDGLCSQDKGLCLSCEPGVYSPNCSLNCASSCSDSEKCSLETGACEGDCKEGFYSDTCTKNCTGNCKNCDRQSGKCTGSCEHEFYGENCEKLCPESCVGKECTDNGSCKACAEGFFGPICKEKCSSGCKEKKCDRYGGACGVCIPGYTGQLCGIKCSNCAGDGSCDKASRACASGCISGYEGDSCSEVSESQIPKILVIVAVSLLLLATLIYNMTRLNRDPIIQPPEDAF